MMNCVVLAAVVSVAEMGVGEPLQTLVVRGDAAFVYETPDFDSAIVRQLFVGELVQPVERVVPDSGQSWVKVRLGERQGFVPAGKLSPAGNLPATAWEPPVIIRDERPLAMGVKILGETFGTALNLRYQPFTRLGATFSVGSILDGGRMRGTALSFGVNTYVVLWNLSPFAEAGVARLSYHAQLSTLRVTSFYLAVGLEWMFDWGGFVNVSATYLRGMDVEVAYEIEDARAGNLGLSRYGPLDLGRDDVFQELAPGAAVGYAF